MAVPRSVAQPEWKVEQMTDRNEVIKAFRKAKTASEITPGSIHEVKNPKIKEAVNTLFKMFDEANLDNFLFSFLNQFLSGE